MEYIFTGQQTELGANGRNSPSLTLSSSAGIISALITSMVNFQSSIS